jgi:peptidoglycan hydrolase-like protein with peptidoglycan-binding domain
MFRIVLLAAALFSALVCGAAASTAGVFLVIANTHHDHLARAPSAAAVLAAVPRFEAAGFEADQGTDLSAPAIRLALDSLDRLIAAERPERVVLVFAGYALHSDQGTWLLGAETLAAPSLINLDATGVRLETLLAIAGRIQGGAVVVIADLGFPGTPGPGLRPGLPLSVPVPQGVSLIRGPAAQLATVLDALARPGTNVGEAVRTTRQARIDGFDPPWLTFLPAGHVPAESADRRAFAQAEALDTPEGWRAYLDVFPQGRFAEQARAALERLENTPERIEERLALTRDERRAVQRHLALLGFDPRGIDGIFGAGTRAAIGSWQRREDLAATGFLDRDQVFRLAAQAARRAAALEEEERQRQAEQERRDRAWWRDTGAGRDEAGIRAYLERFPQGLFAAIARERLAEIEARRRAEDEARDRAAWRAAQAAGTRAAYRAYLAQFPRGAYVAQARAWLLGVTVLPPEPMPGPVTEPMPVPEPGPNPGPSPGTGPSPGPSPGPGAGAAPSPGTGPSPGVDPGPGTEPVPEAARAAEQALNLARATRLQIEQRMLQMGYDPGQVDGRFDRDTRRGIRRFQRDYGLPETGFLDAPELGILLPGGSSIQGN